MILNEEDIKFLKELGKELKTQDRKGTAKPVFYQILDIDIDWNANRCEFEIAQVYSDDGDCLETLEEMKNYILKWSDAFEVEDFEELENNIDEYGIDEIAQIYEDSGFNVCYGTYKRELKGAFLTMKAAEEHLKNNSHHYSERAKVCVSYAWRNPEIEKLLTIIEKFADEGENKCMQNG